MVETKRRQERGKRRIEHVLDVAAQVFAEVGYDAATTNAIAARARISPGSLYQYFPNKDAIAEALAARYVDELVATHDIALHPDIAQLPIDELIDRIVDPLVDFNLRNPSAHALLHGSDISPRLATSTHALHEAVLDRIEVIIGARAPQMPARQRLRAAQVSVQIFKAIQPLVIAARSSERKAVIAELKAALRGYLVMLDRPFDP